MNRENTGGAYWRTPEIIPADWTAEQAQAVFELVDELRDLIWCRYHQGIQDVLRQTTCTDLIPPADPRQLALFPELPPF